jgi:DnaJ-class molecular chaperone
MYDRIIEKQSELLGITYPFINGELRSAFTKLAFIHHPDKGGDAKQFIIIKEAYDFLKAFAIDIKDNKNTKTTAEGDLLSNLGKGLGDLVNQKPCSQCNGKGWESKTHYKYTYERECSNCKGTGYVGKYFNVCFWCFGTGGIGRHEKKVEQIHTCYKCKGTGYIQILNPVLPKNRMFTKAQGKSKKRKKKYCDCGAIVKGNKCWRCGKEYKE